MRPVYSHFAAAVRAPVSADAFVLLWSERAGQAERYAHRIAHHMQTIGRPPSKWMERAADAGFLQGWLDGAEHRYHVALHEGPQHTSPLLKLSDVYFAQSDDAKQRENREMVYGSLGARR